MLRRVNLGEIQLDALPFTAESFASLVKLADEEKFLKMMRKRFSVLWQKKVKIQKQLQKKRAC